MKHITLFLSALLYFAGIPLTMGQIDDTNSLTPVKDSIGYNQETDTVSNAMKTDTAVFSQTAQDSTQNTGLTEPEKPVKKVKPSPPPPPVNPYRDKIDKLVKESKNMIDKGKGDLLRKEKDALRNIARKAIALRKTIENDKLAAEKKKANKKVKCEDCDILIKFAKESINQIDILTGKIHVLLASMTDEQIAEMKSAYWNEVLITAPQDTVTLHFIKTEIERRNKHYLWGWIGIDKVKSKLDVVSANYEQINEKSALFIQQKLMHYSNNDDRAVINDLEKEIPNAFKDIGEFKDELNSISIPYTTLSLIGVVLLLLVIGIAVYLRAFIAQKKSKKIEKENRISRKSGLLIEDDDTLETVSYHVGLNDIKEKSGVEYYAVQMDTISEDTSIREVYLSRKAILDIYKFFSNFLKYDDKTNETGCFLVGRWGYAPAGSNQRYDISIEAIVEPSDDAVYGEYNLNFGAKIGITLDYAIQKLCEKTGNEYVHTAWMHSHPGMGLFLSNQDLGVQSQLAHSQHYGRMLSIVLDSNTPDLKMALFAPKSNGAMNNDKDVKKFLSLETLYQWAKTTPVKEEKLPPPPPTVIQNYFNVEVSSPTTPIAKISMSGSSIIDMDMAIMPDATGLRGYFYGIAKENELIINDFEEFNDELTPKEPAVACFIVLPHISAQETKLIPNDLLLPDNANIAVLYGLEDGKIYIVVQDELLTSLTLREMKEWTRRKR